MKPLFDVTTFVMAYEEGEINYEQTVEGFQHLIDSGLAWQLQGHYGRTAMALLEAGECHDPREAVRDGQEAEANDDNYHGDENA